jgi:S1-C subfamily serine protease
MKFRLSNERLERFIENLTNRGPEQKAGLQAGTRTATVDGTMYTIGGDVIVSINGTRTINMDALSRTLPSTAYRGRPSVFRSPGTGRVGHRPGPWY